MSRKIKLSTVVLCLLLVFSIIPINAFAESGVDFSYSAHMSNIGWMSSVSNGNTAGKIDSKERIEAIKLDIKTQESLSISGGAHIQNVGWVENLTEKDLFGSTGKSRGLEGFYLTLNGEDAENYDIWYRSNTEYYGWLDWAKNGEKSGSQGLSLPIKAVQIKIVKKGEFTPDNNNTAFATTLFCYSAHMSNIGWMSSVSNGNTAGKIDSKERIEAIKLDIKTRESLSISGGAHIQNVGWVENLTKKDLFGSTGKSRGLEGFYLTLNGEDAENYDIWYRSNTEYYGWLDWAKNGEKSGSQGLSLPIKAVQIKIVKKGKFTPDNNNTAFATTLFCYSAHVSNVGWMNYVFSEETAGFTEDTKTHNIEALNVVAKGYGDIKLTYTAHVSNVGWMKTVESGSIAGTTGKCQSIEAIRFELIGKDAQKYDIWYRTYAKNNGWLAWTSNGKNSGSEGKATAIGAIEIKLCPKGEFEPDNQYELDTEKVNFSYELIGQNSSSFSAENGKMAIDPNERQKIFGIGLNISGEYAPKVSCSLHVSNIGWTDATEYSESAKMQYDYQIEAVKLALSGDNASDYDIWYRAYVQGYGWLAWASNGEKVGSSGYALPIYSLQVLVCEKGTFLTDFYGKSFVEKTKVYLFAIDAGHGGSDCGAIGSDGRYEANDNIKVANELVRILKQQGQKTYLINRNLKTQDRPIEANSVNADFFISLHRDSTPQKSGPSGISIYTHEPSHRQRKEQPTKDYAPNEHVDKHQLDEKLVNNLKSYLNGATAIPVKGVYYGSANAPTYEDYYINRLSNMPSCIVELGYVNNAGDNANFDAYYRVLAKQIAKALMATAGVQFNEALYTK